MRISAVRMTIIVTLPLLVACSGRAAASRPAAATGLEQTGPETTSVVAAAAAETLTPTPSTTVASEQTGSETQVVDTDTGTATATTVPPTPTAKAYEPDTATLNAFQYDGWQTYTNTLYGFAIRYPKGWTVDEVANTSNTMYQHRISLTHPAEPRTVLLLAYKRASEDRRIVPTGMTAGDIVERGSLRFVEEPVDREVLVANGKDLEVLYGGGGEIPRDDLIFWIGLHYTGDPVTDPGLSTEVEKLADQVLTSLTTTP